MYLYKYVNENEVIRSKNPLFIEDRVISNPTEETLRNLGYKELVCDEYPTLAENEQAVPHYEDGAVIHCSYTKEVVDYELI